MSDAARLAELREKAQREPIAWRVAWSPDDALWVLDSARSLATELGHAMEALAWATQEHAELRSKLAAAESACREAANYIRVQREICADSQLIGVSSHAEWLQLEGKLRAVLDGEGEAK